MKTMLPPVALPSAFGDERLAAVYQLNQAGARHDFSLPEGIAARQLRPLRDPTSLEEQLAQLP